MKTFRYEELEMADLLIDAIYEGGNAGNVSDDPISKILLGTGNMGGFRIAGRNDRRRWIVLYTSGEDIDWPDTLDTLTGTFIYYGDNKRPGQELHSTRGNMTLREVFEARHARGSVCDLPPIFVFRKCPTPTSSRSVQFLGLVVPGTANSLETEDLVTVWRSAEGKRFQNYRAIFSILDCGRVTRQWIQDLQDGSPLTANAPRAWLDWSERRVYKPLVATPNKETRSPQLQRPENKAEILLLRTIWDHFSASKQGEHAFEHFAAWIFSLTDNRVVIDEVTRRTVDHGRDAVGHYKLGLGVDPVIVDFALEAKCYQPGFDGKKATTVGVEDTSRLISRLLHRQFGVLVTTSVIARQTYKEIRQDGHPIVLIAGGDIARILISKGINSRARLMEELKAFPV